jgi:hypothetical protein
VIEISSFYGVLHLRMEIDPVSETSSFLIFQNTGQWKKSKNPVILCIIHHHQNPLESTWHYIPEDRTLHSYHCKNFKSFILYFPVTELINKCKSSPLLFSFIILTLSTNRVHCNMQNVSIRVRTKNII